MISHSLTQRASGALPELVMHDWVGEVTIGTSPISLFLAGTKVQFSNTVEKFIEKCGGAIQRSIDLRHGSSLNSQIGSLLNGPLESSRLMVITVHNFVDQFAKLDEFATARFAHDQVQDLAEEAKTTALLSQSGKQLVVLTHIDHDASPELVSKACASVGTARRKHGFYRFP